MEKVITLLKSLSTKVAAEGAKEAAQYDKYACFCKEQADEKLYAIEKSDDKLASLKAQITDLDAAIAQLNSDISDLSKKATRLDGEIKTATNKRNTEHAEYEAKATDMNEAIDACGAALDALKDSKGAMTDAKLNLVQVAVEKVLGKGAPKFQYQSNDIIATIEGLQATFKKMKKDLDIEEFDINSAFESKKLGLSNEKTFAEKERDEKAAVEAAKSEEVAAARDDKKVTTADRGADQSFMDELTAQCEEKAGQFDQRSKARSDELTALSDATSELQSGAVPNAGANKKLTGLQKKPAVVQKAALKVGIKPVSFVQINSENNEVHNKLVIQRVLDSLHKAAGRTGSSMLASLGVKAMLAEDHFVKVRTLIKDLISKLKADALSEATQKSTCDKGMSKAVSERDAANAQIEASTSKITTKTALKEQLTAEVSKLQGEIADLKKGLLEATELRAEDKKEHATTVGMSKEAIASVKLALGLLQDFYKNALLQTAKYTPPKSDRSGNTVGDLAPEAFDSTYHGSQSESKGIIGILEVILSDFERTKSTTEKDESESDKAFKEIEADTNKDVAAKEKDIKDKEKTKTDTIGDILAEQTTLGEAKDSLGNSKDALDALEAMCVKGEETWEERKKKREDEIGALKDALQIFEDWQK